MFSISFVSICLSIIANVQACETQNKHFTKGGFFTGVAAAYGIPIFFLGDVIHSVGKEDLKLCRREEYHLIMRNVFAGRVFKSIGAGLVIIPLLVNNHQFFRERIRK
jgi:hypothetical protein